MPSAITGEVSARYVDGMHSLSDGAMCTLRLVGAGRSGLFSGGCGACAGQGNEDSASERMGKYCRHTHM